MDNQQPMAPVAPAPAAPAPEAPVMQPQPGMPAQPAMPYAPAAAPAKKKTGLIIGLIAGAVVIIAGVVIALVLILNRPKLEGTYVLSDIESEEADSESTAAGLALLKAFGANIEFEAKGDGKCEMKVSVMGQEQNSECTYTDKTITTVDEDGKTETVDYSVDGDKLTMKNEGASIIFEKKK